MNLFPLHEHCHMNNPGFGRITDQEAEYWEMFLTAFRNLVLSGCSIRLNLVLKELEILREEVLK